MADGSARTDDSTAVAPDASRKRQKQQQSQSQQQQLEDERMLSSLVSLLSSGRTSGGDAGLPLCAKGTLGCVFASPPPGGASAGPASTCLSLPSLDLKNKAVTSGITRGMSLLEAAAFNLAVPILVDHDADHNGRKRRDETLSAVPADVLRNFSDSFQSLVESRLRSSLAALLKQTLIVAGRNNVARRTTLPVVFGGRSPRMQQQASAAAAAQSAMIIGLLSKADPVEVTAAVTLFRTVPVAQQQQGRDNDKNDVASRSHSCIVPLVFEAVLDLSILGSSATAILRAPGTVTGHFGPSDDDGGGKSRLHSAEIVFDTIALLSEMMKQARAVVKSSLKSSLPAAAAASAEAASSPSSSSIADTSPSSPSRRSSMPSASASVAMAKDGMAMARDARRKSVQFVKTVPLSSADDVSARTASTGSLSGSSAGYSSSSSSSSSLRSCLRSGSFGSISTMEGGGASSSSVKSKDGDGGGEESSCSSTMPPPRPRSPLHSSRSLPRLLYHTGRRSSAELLGEGRIPAGSRTSERSKDGDGDGGSESVPSGGGLNESWDCPPPGGVGRGSGSRGGSSSSSNASAAAAATSSGFALLRKRKPSSNNGGKHRQAEEAARDSKRQKTNRMPLRKRRVTSCPEMA